MRVFKESLRCLPPEVETVRLRSDTAGYQHDLLRYCDTDDNKRFGKIEFAVGCKVTDAFRQAVQQVPDEQWRPIYSTIGKKKLDTGVEWAEVCFVPNEIGHSKNGPEYRYLAKRQKLEETLPGMPDTQMTLPFPTLETNNGWYKLFGVVTNIAECVMIGEDVIHWLHKRCGKSEAIHSVMKHDLAGGTLPSGDFGENAAWWWIMILSLNLNQMMKQLALKPEMKNKRMKAIRYAIINLPGRVIKKSRQLIIRLAKGHPGFKTLLDIRKQIASLEALPSG
ncbi:MAG: hypothetical protein GY729_08525 [Desulfobacteraceae bacterium]|nr:hypothetical protein [Desulfobacteraceae bacterium]